MIDFVTANPDQMLVIEVQVLKKMPGENFEPEMKLSSFREQDFDYDHSQDKFKTFAWTCVNLFTSKRTLLEGAFRIPLYFPPT